MESDTENNYSLGIVAEVRSFWWIQAVQMAVQYIKTEEAHFWMCNHSISHTIWNKRSTITRYTSRIVQLLFFSSATSSSHLYPQK
jgi:hypothetical protein